jgi:Ca2+-binding EF-hand superfamily protein
MHEYFKQLDESGDGNIQLDEWIEFQWKMKPLIPKSKIEKETRESFKKIDLDGNGDLDFYEWSSSILETLM